MRWASCLSVWVLVAGGANGAAEPAWNLVESANFQVYSQVDAETARAGLKWFEQLRAFFEAAGVQVDTRPAVRVIGFRSVKEYDSYRLRSTSDAYYVGTESRDYIVLPALDPSRFVIAAHEYAHAVLHASGLRLPSWLSEGLAEFFSTVRINDRGCQWGGDIRSHSQTLRARTWMPLSRLLEIGPESLSSRQESELFYAESWALTEMLLVSPEYRFRFSEVVAALASGLTSEAALVRAYHRPLEAITRDLHERANNGQFPVVTAPGVAITGLRTSSSQLTSFEAQSLLGELLLASGELDRAESAFHALALQSPHNPEVFGALGGIALRKGDITEARLNWKRAMTEGITDASLCYRYAVLADNAGLPPDEIRPALERAIALEPNFDDARYMLALLESHAGNYQAAVTHLKNMRTVGPERAFAYWVAMSSAQEQLAEHDASKISARKALEFAATPEQRAQARQLAYVATTELTVQFTRDENGNSRMETARVPRGTRSWNPFIEPQDHIRSVTGRLRSVECRNGKIAGIVVDTETRSVKLDIPDPLHVLIQGLTEFVCGPQEGKTVAAEYAAAINSSPNKASDDGVLRGMEAH